MRLRSLPRRAYSLFAIVAFLVVFPLLRPNPYILYAVMTILLYTAMCQGWNLLAGYTGYKNWGAAAFHGLGAYSTGLLVANFGIHPFLTLPITAVVVAAFASVFGLLAIRLRGPYFLLATVTVTNLLYFLAFIFEPITGGGWGLPLPRPPPDVQFYYLILPLAIVTHVAIYKIVRSKFGLRLVSIREDEDAAEVLGINTTKHKVLALIISILPMGLAGAIQGTMWTYVQPDEVFKFYTSLLVVLFTRFGGAGTLIGPIVGPCILLAVSEYLIFTFSSEINILVLGAFLVVVMRFLPQGIYKPLTRLFAKMQES